MDASVQRYGQKRTREGTTDTSPAIRFAGTGLDGQPEIAARTSDYRWNALPPEVTLKILHTLDLPTHIRMLQVSHYFRNF